MLTEKYFKPIFAVGLALVMSCSPFFASAQETMDHSQMDHGQNNADEHAQHMAMMNQEAYSITEVSYELPDVMLTDQNGDNVAIATLLNGEEPVMVNFIFTTCSTICPVLSAIFAQAQKRYGNELAGVKLISISIDPEYDTPAKLQEYAQRFHAKEGWTFLTGDLDTVIDVLTSLDAYNGDKMNHIPLTLIRKPGSSKWLRLEGFPDASDLVKAYQSS